jgi:two-component sensor histidine kinase
MLVSSSSSGRSSVNPSPEPAEKVHGDAKDTEHLAVLEALNLPVSLITPQYTYQWVNSCYSAAQGKNPDELIGKTVRALWGEAFDKAIKGNLDRCFEGAEVRDEAWINYPALGPRYCETVYSPYSPDGGHAISAIVVTYDLTERKQAEEQVKTSLREKEVLLQEIHHRVKNNLQIVSSLLYLQSTRTEHPEAISALRESRDRVKSMALIHERLYQSPNLASIDAGEYVRSLVSDLRRSYMTEESSVQLTVKIDEIHLGISEAIPCGLIINELVSNALKHAFPDGREGEITIQLQRAGANQIALTVSDSGVGLPEQVDFRKAPSLGLTLISSLVDQLDGAIELDRSKGTAFTITFG